MTRPVHGIRFAAHRVLAAAALTVAAHASPAEAASPASDWPLWAYGVTAPPQPGDRAVPQREPGPWFRPDLPREEQLRPLRIEGSTRTYSMVELNDWQHTPDWFPEQHGPVPVAISRGPASLGDKTRACGFCHRIHGGGRPENAPVFGLPVAYFLRQIDDFRAGRRHSSDPRKANVPTMVAMARALSDDEARAVAEFWAAQSGGPRLRVVESDRAPPARLHGNLFVRTSQDATEPLSDRILEVPEDFERSGDLDDPRSGYVAYVPTGSIARGRALVEQAPLSCATCHGADLRGLGDVPPIAGRSPSYIVRQLHDFRTGARNGSLAPLMIPAVADLDSGEMLDIAAYLASLPLTAPPTSRSMPMR